MNLLSTPRCPRYTAESAPAKLSRPEQVAMALGLGMPFVGFVAAVVLLWHVAVGPVEILLLLGMYSLTVFGVDVGYHRLFTHRGFSCPAWVRFVLAAMGSMALQGPVIQWCAVHRRHHQSSDREGDPHSPHVHRKPGMAGWMVGFWHAHMGWLFDADPVDLGRSVKDLLNDPATMWADRLFWVFVVLGLAIPAAVGGLVHHSWGGAALGLIWGGLARMFLMHHATFSINSVCHVWGARPYQSGDESRNNPIFGIVSFGEGWHNNHHAFPTSARHGLEWWQVDFAWYFIKAMQVSGLAWDVRLPSGAARAAKRRASVTSPAEGPTDGSRERSPAAGRRSSSAVPLAEAEAA